MFSLAFKSGVSWNESFWSHEQFDALLLEARAELDEAKRREMYWVMQDIVANQGGVAIPMFASYVFATRPSVGTPRNNGLESGSRWIKLHAALVESGLTYSLPDSDSSCCPCQSDCTATLSAVQPHVILKTADRP